MTRQALLSALQAEYPALTISDDEDPRGGFIGDVFHVSDGDPEHIMFLNIANLVDGGGDDSIYVNAAKTSIDGMLGAGS